MIEKTGVIGGLDLPEKAEHTREIDTADHFFANVRTSPLINSVHQIIYYAV